MTNPNWLSAPDWKRIQDTVPVCCVDVVPVQRNARGEIARVGLIYRETPHQGRRWCVVGGRLFRNESFAEGVARQIRETLGPGVRFALDESAEPDHVAQYFTHERGPGPVDPRQHAIGITFCVEIEGEAAAGGEAVSFQWFNLAELPHAEEFGFRQNRVVDATLRRRGAVPPGTLAGPAAGAG